MYERIKSQFDDEENENHNGKKTYQATYRQYQHTCAYFVQNQMVNYDIICVRD